MPVEEVTTVEKISRFDPEHLGSEMDNGRKDDTSEQTDGFNLTNTDITV